MIEAPDNQASTDAAQGQANADVAPVSGPPSTAIPQPPPTPAKDHRAENKRRWTNDPAMFWITLAGVVAVIAYTTVAGWQAHLMSNQLDAMRDQLNAMAFEERPWLSLDVTPNGPLLHDAKGWDYGISWYLPLNYRVKNVGKTPATDVAFFAHIAPVVSGEGGLVVREEIHRVCDFWDRMKKLGGGYELVFPQEEWPENHFTVFGDETSFEAAKKLDPSKAKYFGQFLVTACVIYRPTFPVDTPYATAKQYYVADKSRAAIDLNSTGVSAADLAFHANALSNGTLAR